MTIKDITKNHISFFIVSFIIMDKGEQFTRKCNDLQLNFEINDIEAIIIKDIEDYNLYCLYRKI